MTDINRGRVVIVDDDCEVGLSLQGIIEISGYEAHTFDNGCDALSFLGDHEVDLVLTDIRMPGMDGIELLDSVLALNADIPVILMTAFADIDLTISAIKIGAFDFIIKPYDPVCLLKTLEKGVAFRRRYMAERNYRQDLEREVEERTRELKKAHEIVLQNEKMALVGQIAAGVVHEINNPVGFISSNLETFGRYAERLLVFFGVLTESLGRYCPTEELERIEEMRRKAHIDKIADDLPAILEESQEGVERITEIVRNLKGFSRVDDGVFVSADINDVISKALNIVKNEIKYVATVITDYGEIPPAQCLPNQLTQVFMNILINASHAIKGHGEITVRSWYENEKIYVTISDTGCGIPEDVKKNIFVPFFTTKESGKGTGLGLSISYDIIHKHSGEISVESAVGKGTTFNIMLPEHREQGVKNTVFAAEKN
ncbi:MAG: response regulator [Desulfuromonadaceae bacterium]|nr:response regulator [Desulfuromonadaceae bacterium]